jgi:hypothetical protein
MEGKAWVRITAAVFGTLLFSLAAGLCIARWAPVAPDLRIALGFFLPFPLWVTAMCWGFLVRRGARAWAILLTLSGVLTLLGHVG